MDEAQLVGLAMFRLQLNISVSRVKLIQGRSFQATAQNAIETALRLGPVPLVRKLVNSDAAFRVLAIAPHAPRGIGALEVPIIH